MKVEIKKGSSPVQQQMYNGQWVKPNGSSRTCKIEFARIGRAKEFAIIQTHETERKAAAIKHVLSLLYRDMEVEESPDVFTYQQSLGQIWIRPHRNFLKNNAMYDGLLSTIRAAAKFCTTTKGIKRFRDYLSFVNYAYRKDKNGVDMGTWRYHRVGPSFRDGCQLKLSEMNGNLSLFRRGKLFGPGGIVSSRHGQRAANDAAETAIAK